MVLPGLDGEVPDHSTFSKNRHGRFRDCDLLRKLFETVVRRCMAEGLVDGTAFAVDASLIAADASKQRSAVGTDGDDCEALALTRRSVRGYLDTLDSSSFYPMRPRNGPDLKAAVIVDVEAHVPFDRPRLVQHTR